MEQYYKNIVVNVVQWTMLTRSSKKGKYTVRDGNTGKVIATYSSGEKGLQKKMHKTSG